jgi:hypothetical protein
MSRLTLICAFSHHGQPHDDPATHLRLSHPFIGNGDDKGYLRRAGGSFFKKLVLAAFDAAARLPLLRLAAGAMRSFGSSTPKAATLQETATRRGLYIMSNDP